MTSLKKFQNFMKKNRIDIFLVNHADEFLSEYIAPYAERLNWISNFSGSAGRAIIEQDRAYIFIDGRYTFQVNTQVDKKLFQIKHITAYWDYLETYNTKNRIISLDPKNHSVSEIKKMKLTFSESSLNYIKNPIDFCWQNQPSYPKNKVFLHDIKYSGKEAFKKIIKIQEAISLTSCDFYLLNSLDSIAWLLNIRGNDIENTPLVHCYAIIPCKGKIELFTNSEISHLLDNLKNIVNISSLESIDYFISSSKKEKIFGMDYSYTPYYFKKILNESKILAKDIKNPCLYPKAIKNKIELSGARQANIRDGVSITKFLYWLKNKIIIREISEKKAAEYLFNLRKNNYLFYSLSFDTISAFGSNAALPHYKVTDESNLSFTSDSIYLVDSGAQYRDGTTDITRTIIIGKPTSEQKDRFTRVLKGHIAIAKAEFPIGSNGSFLDPLARKYLQQVNCDYDHGTGHGIGSFLSVHEGPQRIAKSQDKNEGIIKKGMILSNEPGYYKKNEYGIRIENLIICQLKNNTSLKFETISWAPIDIDLLEVSLLDEKEKEWLNDYHSKVYDNVGPSLEKNEEVWLRNVTFPIK